MSEQPLALVLRTAGTNCDAELCRAFELSGAAVELVHIKALIAEPSTLERASLIGFPGGFSHGDDIAAGRVLAATIRQGLAEPLRAAADRGVCMIGVCNGFQVMVQCGLLPTPGGGQTVALAENDSGRFIDRWVAVEANTSSPCVWTKTLSSYDTDAGRLPIAHGEGRVVVRDPSTLESLEASGQIPLRYAEPVNGSAGDAAGICDPSGRIFGLMPHPERYLSWSHHPFATSLGGRADDAGDTPGLAMFRSAVRAATDVAAGV